MAFLKDTLWILGEGAICAGLIALVSLHPRVPCCENISPPPPPTTTTTLPPTSRNIPTPHPSSRPPILLPQAQPWGGFAREEYWGYSRVYPQQNYEWVQVP